MMSKHFYLKSYFWCLMLLTEFISPMPVKAMTNKLFCRPFSGAPHNIQIPRSTPYFCLRFLLHPCFYRALQHSTFFAFISPFDHPCLHCLLQYCQTHTGLLPLKSTVFPNNTPGTVESLLVSEILCCNWTTFPSSFLQLLCLEIYLLAEGWLEFPVTAGISAQRKYRELTSLFLWP